MVESEKKRRRESAAEPLPQDVATILIIVFALIGVALSFVELPGLFDVNILQYDASSVAALMIGLIAGPLIGCIVGAGITILHGVFAGNIVGVVINLCLMVSFTLPPVIAYRRRGTIASIVVGLAVGSILALGMNILLNIIVLPHLIDFSTSEIIAMLTSTLLPFSLIKIGLNTGFSFIFVLIFWIILKFSHRAKT